MSSIKCPVPVLPRRHRLSIANETSQLFLNIIMRPKMWIDVGQMWQDFVCHNKEIYFYFLNGTGELLKVFMSERKVMVFEIRK